MYVCCDRFQSKCRPVGDRKKIRVPCALKADPGLPSKRTRMTDTALLVIDMQRDFLEHTGKLPLAEDRAERTLRSVNAAIADAVASGKAVVYVVNAFRDGDWTNIFRKWAAIEGTPGAELHPRLSIVSPHVFPKDRGNALSNPALLEFLRERKIVGLVIVGVYADQCVAATVKGARDHGFEVIVLQEAVGAVSDARAEAAVRRFRQLGARVA